MLLGLVNFGPEMAEKGWRVLPTPLHLAAFASKIELLSKEVYYKVSLCETRQVKLRDLSLT